MSEIKSHVIDGSPAHGSDRKTSIPFGPGSGAAGSAALCASVVVLCVWLGEGGEHRRAVAVSLLLAGLIASVELMGMGRGRERRIVMRRSASRVRMRALILLGILMAGITGMTRSSAEWSAVDAVRLGTYRGEATVVGDSKEIGRGRRVILEIDGQRFESWLFGSKRHRANRLESGDVVAVEGVRTGFTGDQARRSQIRHVLGRFELSEMASVIDGHQRSAPLVRAANRVRGMIRKGADLLDVEHGALFTGLVYGDDSSQPPEMVEDFRASGLAHLTAVSGQNVVFVLAMAGPLLARMRRSWRIGCTLVLLVWFAIMTRLEPSVIRAVFMAGTSALMAGVGGPVSSWVALCLTVGVASLIDPFLVWSVGWWLSVAGCAGLIVATPPIGRLFDRFPTWVSSWISPTIAAQTGVLGVIVGVFGWPSAMSIPCNLLAAPVAGLVMLIGLPFAIVGGLLPTGLGHAVMWPIGWGVAWVEGVASLGARIDPPTAVDMAVSLTLAGFTGWAVVRFRLTREDFTDGVSPDRSPL
ncbi:MAG: ComEC/Rec2 family competence protein [Actinomycetota bacterium]